MRKTACILLIQLLTIGYCHARILTIGSNQSFKTIQSALERAKDDDTLLVFPGTYAEGHLSIKKRICLLGFGQPILDGDFKYEVITILRDSVTIRGFHIQNSGVANLEDPGGLRIKGVSHVEVSNCFLTNNFFGIYLENAKACRIQDNVVLSHGVSEEQIGNGIHAWKCDSLIITHNYVSGHRDGIYFEFVSNSIIWRNTSKQNVRYGLHFMFSNHDSYITNTFHSNGAGVAVMFSNHVTMMNNKFLKNWGDASYGLLLKEISDSHISGNKFLENTIGIYMEGTSRLEVNKNLFLKNGWGMQIQASCLENIISQSNFQGNTFDISTNGSVVLNSFTTNYWEKYQGYDLDKNGIGDVPYRPLSLYSVLVEKNPTSMLLYNSLMVELIDQSEKIFPSLTPENFIDNSPAMKPFDL